MTGVWGKGVPPTAVWLRGRPGAERGGPTVAVASSQWGKGGRERAGWRGGFNCGPHQRRAPVVDNGLVGRVMTRGAPQGGRERG